VAGGGASTAVISACQYADDARISLASQPAPLLLLLMLLQLHFMP